MEDNYEDPEQRGIEAVGVWLFLQIRRSVDVALWCGNVGGYPLHGTGTGGFSRPGGATTDGASATAEVRQEMGVRLRGGGKRGGGVRADGDLHSAKVEYGCAVHCYMTNSGLVRGVREKAGGMGMYLVVRTGVN